MKCSERRQRNTTERQSNTIPLAQGSYFSKKKAALSGTRTTTVGVALTNTHMCTYMKKTYLVGPDKLYCGTPLSRQCSYELHLYICKLPRQLSWSGRITHQSKAKYIVPKASQPMSCIQQQYPTKWLVQPSDYIVHANLYIHVIYMYIRT